jgi:hypothetical protein
MSAKKFYKTVLKVVVLSEAPVDFDNLAEVHHAITRGDCSGQFTEESVEEVDGPTMARLLEEQGSDPGFFGLQADDEDEEAETSLE